MQVGPAAESLESPSPSVSPATPSLVTLSPPPVSLVGDALSFMGFYTEDDIVNLEQWAVDSGGLRGTPDFRLEKPEISPHLKTFLRFTIGAQWEFKLAQPAGKSSFVS